MRRLRGRAREGPVSERCATSERGSEVKERSGKGAGEAGEASDVRKAGGENLAQRVPPSPQRPSISIPNRSLRSKTRSSPANERPRLQRTPG
eukprot:1183791-Prorocentrum_minimum.AAC.3